MDPPSKALAHLNDRDYEIGLENYLRELFGFLVDDFNFEEIASRKPQEIRLANATTMVVIRSEWEGPWVALDRAKEPRNAEYGSIPLWALMTVRKSPNLYSGEMPAIDRFVTWAEELPKCAPDVLRGDFSIEPEVDRLLEERATADREWERRLHLDSAVSSANEAFHDKNYRAVVEHLEPFLDELTKAQRTKLSYARKQLKG